MRGLQECLDALREVIISQQSAAAKHEPTPSEFFALIAATLSTRIEEDKLPLLLKIFVGVIPNASTSLLRAQFRPIIQSLLNVVKLVAGNARNDLGLSLALEAIGKVLVQQETSQGFWDGVQALQAFNALLSFIDDQHPRVRKTAVQALIDILSHHTKQRFLGMRSYFTEFALGVLKSCSRANYRRGLCLVIMLESAFVFASEAQARKLLEACIKLQSCEISKLTAAVYRMVDSTFQHPSFAFSAATTSSLFSYLLSHKPSTADVETQCYFYSALGSSFLAAQRLDADTAGKALGKVLELMVLGCEAEFTQVHIALCTSWKRIVQQTLNANALKLVKIPGQWSGQSIHKVSSKSCPPELLVLFEHATALDKMLAFRYQLSWLYTLDVLRAYLQACRGHADLFFLVSGLVSKLADIVQGIVQGSQSIDTSMHNALLDTLASALHACGLSTFLRVVPLMDSAVARGELLSHIRSRDWLLELLQQEVKHLPCALGDFVVTILPMAVKLNKLLQEASEAAPTSGPNTTNEVAKKILRNRVVQLWSLLPELCQQSPSDLVSAFPKMTNLLTQAIQEENYPEIAFAAARTCGRLAGHFLTMFPTPQAMASSSSTSSTLATVQQLAGHYLPLLLQFSESLSYGDGKLSEVLSSLAQWMRLGPESLARQTCRHLLKLVLSHTHAMGGMDASGFDKAAIWMATLLVVIPTLSPSLVNLIYQTICPMLAVDESIALQKNCYALLHALLQHHASTLFEQAAGPEGVWGIWKVVRASLVTAHVSTRTMRLKCIRSLLEQMQDEQVVQAMEDVITEVLICQKDANRKCREGAIQVLRIFMDRIPAQQVFKRVCVEVKDQEMEGGEAAMRCASALNALSLLLLEFGQKYWRLRRVGRMRGRQARETEKEAEGVEDAEVQGQVVGGKRQRRDEDEEEEEEGHEEVDGEYEGDENEEESEGAEDEESMEEGSDDGMDDAAAAAAVDATWEDLQFLSVSLLPSISLLLTMHSSEQTKACLTYLKVLSGFVKEHSLATSAPQILRAAFVDVGSLKEKFATRLRGIVRKLGKRMDWEQLRPLLPEADQALVDYIARQQRKEWRSKQKRQLESEREKWSKFERAMASDSEASDDEGGDEEGDDGEDGAANATEDDYRLAGGRRFKATRVQGTGLQSLLPSMLDSLLQGQDLAQAMAGKLNVSGAQGRMASRTAAAQPSLPRMKRGHEALAAVDRDEGGKHRTGGHGAGEEIVAEDEDEAFQVAVSADGKVHIRQKVDDSKKNKQAASKRQAAEMSKAERAAQALTASTTAASSGGRQNKKRKLLNLKEPGVEYRAKKAGGDVWKKGVAVQPHAYIPLDPRLLSKKHRAQAVEHFAVVVDSNKRNKELSGRRRVVAKRQNKN